MLKPRIRFLVPVVLLLLLSAAYTAQAQVEDQLSAYSEANATGYLQPIADAFGAGLNDGFFRSAHIPEGGVHISLELRAMVVGFADEDRTFQAVPEGGFTPDDRVEAPTVIGAEDAVFIQGDGGAQFAFPGGFDLGSFALAVPQLRVSAYRGTEAILRWVSVETGDAELGDISLFGVGARHSLSRYLRDEFPVDLALGFLWQKFSVGKNRDGDTLMSTSSLAMGIQASRRFSGGIAALEPYAGLGIDSAKMDVEYESDAGSESGLTKLDFDRDTNVHLTMGLALNLWFLNLHGDYSIAGQNSYSVGLAVGNLSY